MTYNQAWEYIKSDYIRYGKAPSLLNILLNGIIPVNHCFYYSFWFRLAKVRGFFYPIAKFMHFILSRRYGIQIPIKTEIGYGFYIGHGVGVIINGTAQIGNNVNISQFCTIGAHGKAARIGDNVYIGPAVCIVNDVVIGNDVTIGAGAVVTTDIPDKATVVGVPAKVLHLDNAGKFINNRYTPIK